MSNARTANCPNCNYLVDLPHKFMRPAWRELACHSCKTRLDLMPPRVSRFLPVIAMLPILFSSITHLVPDRTRAGVFLMGALFGGYVVGLITIAVFWLWESRHPVLRIRRIPKPEITLNLDLKSPENIRTLR
jgi:hypothetical protein